MGASLTDSSIKIPQHIAIIMDGNGRWAETRSFGRTRGHREGAKSVDDITTECSKIGVKYLTLYAFSTENWARPTAEVNMLMRFLAEHLKKLDKKLIKNRVKLVVQGEIERLPSFVQTELKRVIRQTYLDDPALTLNLCLSYGARQELIDAFTKMGKKIKQGELEPEAISEDTVREHLYHPELPDPDLLIRTAGEYRVSNFLLWQIAYSEIYVTDVLWPDFDASELHLAIRDYSMRVRKFGKTSKQIRQEASASL